LLFTTNQYSTEHYARCSSVCFLALDTRGSSTSSKFGARVPSFGPPLWPSVGDSWICLLAQICWNSGKGRRPNSQKFLFWLLRPATGQMQTPFSPDLKWPGHTWHPGRCSQKVILSGKCRQKNHHPFPGKSMTNGHCSWDLLKLLLQVGQIGAVIPITYVAVLKTWEKGKTRYLPISNCNCIAVGAW
jgi:hypothetical protein